MMRMTTRWLAMVGAMLMLAFLLSIGSVAEAANTCTNSGDWSSTSTWDGGVPSATDDVVIPSGKTVTLSSATAVMSLTNSGTLIFTNWDTTLTASNVVVEGIVTLPMAFDDGAMSNRVYFACTNFILGATGLINAKGKGYRGGTKTDPNGHGPGKGTQSGGYYGGGGGYGGRGGKGGFGTGGSTYGSLTAPTDPGSGGAGNPESSTADGAAGGGAVRIAASGPVTIDGTISVDGLDTTSYSGGGSGGSIYIACRTLAGSGFLTATGGLGSVVGSKAGGGGGGRIAVVYDKAAQAAVSKPSIRFSVKEGFGGYDSYNPTTMALVGTLYLPDEALFKSPFDNFNGVRIYGPTNWAVDSLVATNCAVRFAETVFRLTVTNAMTFGTGAVFQVGSEFDPMLVRGVTCGDLSLTNGGALYVHSGPTNASGPNYGTVLEITNSLSIAPNSWLIPVSDPVNGGSVLITVSNVTIAAGGGIDANGRGYRGMGGAAGVYDGGKGYGPGGGPGIDCYGSGGGYGGAGSAYYLGSGGGTYGSADAPIQPGSGGGGNGKPDGGGVVRIEATGAVQMDGTIRANGVTNRFWGGGGSGGGIFIACKTFAGAGSGQLLADGGNCPDYTPSYSGGGGGGRISVVIGLSTADVQKVIDGEAVEGLKTLSSYLDYAGLLSVAGGTDGHGHNGGAGTKQFMKVNAGYSLLVTATPAAYGTPAPYVYGLHLDIPGGILLTNTVNTPVTVGGGLRRTCYGWVVSNEVSSVMTNGAGGEAVVTMTENLILTYLWTNQYELTVTSAVPERGCVNSSAVAGWYTNGVQASGILATASNDYLFFRWSGDVPVGLETNNPLTVTMDQARSLRANFASLYGEAKLWDGTTGSWMDGARWVPGGVPGPLDQVTIGTGTVTLAEGADIVSLTVSNGATLVMSNWNTRVTASNVVIQGIITLPMAFEDGAMSNRVYFVCTNFTLAATGWINAKGKGYRGGTQLSPAGQGPGKGGLAGDDYYGGGGGYGGRGGKGAFGAGGVTYGSLTAPTAPGSGGSGNPLTGTADGAAGGGAVRIAALGAVTIDGAIAADGFDTASYSGGGSGGSIFITCRTLAGSGFLTATGGMGSVAGNKAGGGGGGRIAVVYDTAAQAAVSKPSIRFAVKEGFGGYDSYNPTTMALVGTLYLPDEALFKSPFDNFNGVRIYGPTNWAVDSLVATNCAVRFAEPQFRLTVTNTFAIGTAATFRVGSELDPVGYHALSCGELVITNGGKLYVMSGPTNSTPGDCGALVSIAGALAIYSNSWILPVSDSTNGGSVLITASSVFIGAGGGFDADGCGYRGGGSAAGFGPGKGGRNNIYGGGGGYGGSGGTGCWAGTDGGGTYGSSNAPIGPGSGGGGDNIGNGGYGGGSVRVKATGAVTVNGTIKANGYHSGFTQGWYGGGGAGGGIFIACGTFRGAATACLSAEGGNSRYDSATSYGGGGGGGRIAVVAGFGDSGLAQLIAGEAVARLKFVDSTALGYYGTTSVSNGISVGGVVAAGTPGTVFFLKVMPAPGTIFLIR